MKKIKTLIFFVQFAVISTTFASPYSWQEVATSAQKNNSELKAAEANLSNVLNQRKALWGDFLPRLSAGLSVSDQTVERRTSTFATSTSYGKNYSASLDASLNLFSGFRDWSRLGQAGAVIEREQAKYLASRARVYYDLKAAYENLLYALQYQKLAEEIIKRRKENLKIVELRYESGLENKGSLLLSEAYLAQAEYDALQAKNAEQTAKAQLARAIGFDQFEEFTVEGEIPFAEPPTQTPAFESLVEEVPEYQESKAQEKNAEEGIVLAKSNFLPSLNLTGSWKKTGEQFFPEENKQTVFTLTLSIPLFDGGKDWFGTSAAVESHTNFEQLRRNSRRVVVAKLKLQYATYVESVAKFKADALFREAAQARAQIARNKYNNGLLNFENWDIIESDLIGRQKSYLSSRRDRILAQAQWDQTLGRGIGHE